MQQLLRMMTTERLRHGGGRRRRYTRHADTLLEFFALHRVAVAGQVERQFRSLLYSDRTTRLHLRTLVEAGDLKVMRCRGVGQPNVYRITNRGMAKVTAGERAADAATPSRQRSALGNHLLHELLITEFAVGIGASVRGRTDLKLLWQERFGLVGQSAFAGLVPDYAFLFRHSQGMLISLVEVSSGEESPTRLGEKLQHYAAWASTSLGQSFLTEKYRRFGAQAARPQFRLAFLMQNRRTGKDESRLKQVLSAAIQSSPEILRRLWVTTVQEFCRSPDSDRAVWIRGADFERLVPSWTQLSRRSQRRALQTAVRGIARHFFFPSPNVP